MAFQQKEWKNRLSENPVRRLLTPVDGSTPFQVDVTRAEGTIMQAGDPFNAANMNDLEARIASAIGGGDGNIAPTEEGPESANAYVVGQLLIYDGQLYRVIDAIAIGNSLVEGINIEATTISSEFVDELTANGNRIYMDYKDGKYGYNTSPTRGADTFHPFNGYEYLGSGTSFDVSSYPGYQNFTTDNFIVEPDGATSIPSNFGSNPGAGNTVGFWGVTGGSASIVKSYNASTGVLTAYLQAGAGAGVNSERTSTSGTGGVKAYLLLSV